MTETTATTKIEIELTADAMGHLVKLKIELARRWECEVTDSRAIMHLLSLNDSGEWRIEDLMPPEPEGSA